MKAKLAFVAGLGAGYVLGTRVGRRGYDELKTSARSLWEADKVQETVARLEDAVKDEARDLGSRLVGKATGTAPKPADHDTLPDVESDPALNDVAGRDWADEGGALPSGPSQ